MIHIIAEGFVSKMEDFHIEDNVENRMNPPIIKIKYFKNVPCGKIAFIIDWNTTPSIKNIPPNNMCLDFIGYPP
jgi:hypothetical protein